MNVHLLFVLLALAAVLGNSVNYAIGRWLGKTLLHRPAARAGSIPKHLEQGARVLRAPRRQGGRDLALPADRAHLRAVRGRHGRHGRRAIHGLQRGAGASLWVGSLTYAGFFFGNIPWMQRQPHARSSSASSW